MRIPCFAQDGIELHEHVIHFAVRVVAGPAGLLGKRLRLGERLAVLSDETVIGPFLGKVF